MVTAFLALVLIVLAAPVQAGFFPACKKPDRDWTQGGTRRDCIRDCRINPYSKKHECGVWYRKRR